MITAGKNLLNYEKIYFAYNQYVPGTEALYRCVISYGHSFSIVESTFNNFLNERFALTGFQRSFLEFPRELPGFLVVFVSASLWFLCSRRQTAVAMLLCCRGCASYRFSFTCLYDHGGLAVHLQCRTASFYTSLFSDRDGACQRRQDRAASGAAQCDQEPRHYHRKSSGVGRIQVSGIYLSSHLCAVCFCFCCSGSPYVHNEAGARHRSRKSI